MASVGAPIGDGSGGSTGFDPDNIDFEGNLSDLFPDDFGQDNQNFFLNPGAGRPGVGSIDFDPFQYQSGQGQGLLQGIASNSNSIQNFNRAANRLDDRLAIGARNQRSSLLDQNLGSGFTGNLGRGLERINIGRQQALGQGLVGLESEFEKNRLQELGIQGQAASSLGGLELGEQQLKQKALDDQQSLQKDVFLELEKLIQGSFTDDAAIRSGNLGKILELMNQLKLGKGGIAVDIINALG